MLRPERRQVILELVFANEGAIAALTPQPVRSFPIFRPLKATTANDNPLPCDRSTNHRSVASFARARAHETRALLHIQNP